MDFMIEDLQDFEDKYKELSLIKAKMNTQLLGYIKNGIEYAIEKKRYRFLPSTILEIPTYKPVSFNSDSIFVPLQIAYSLLEKQILQETGLSKIYPKLFISGDSSDGKFTKAWTTALTSSSYTSIYKKYKKNIFDDSACILAKSIASLDNCFKKYVRRGILPFNQKTYLSSFEDAISSLKIKDLGYLLPLNLFSIFKRPLELSGNFTDSRFAVLIVFTDGINLENEYFALMYFKCPDFC